MTRRVLYDDIAPYYDLLYASVDAAAPSDVAKRVRFEVGDMTRTSSRARSTRR